MQWDRCPERCDPGKPADIPLKPKRSRFTRSGESVSIPLLSPLFEDVVECEELLERSDTQFARRALVRAAFAFNEGYVYWLKGKVTQWLLEKSCDTGNSEIAKILLLSDDSYRPNRQGKIESEPNRISFLNLCAFVLRTAAECWDSDPSTLFSDNGWKEMQVSLEIRHRITHPKKPEDLDISDDELYSISEAHQWLFDCLADILNSIPRDSGDAAGGHHGDPADRPAAGR